MFKIWNWLFGWDYVHLKIYGVELIRRVRYTHDGERYVCWFSSNLIFIDRSDCTWEVTPLTGIAPPAIEDTQ